MHFDSFERHTLIYNYSLFAPVCLPHTHALYSTHTHTHHSTHTHTLLHAHLHFGAIEALLFDLFEAFLLLYNMQVLYISARGNPTSPPSPLSFHCHAYASSWPALCTSSSQLCVCVSAFPGYPSTSFLLLLLRPLARPRVHIMRCTPRCGTNWGKQRSLVSKLRECLMSSNSSRNSKGNSSRCSKQGWQRRGGDGANGIEYTCTVVQHLHKCAGEICSGSNFFLSFI